MGNIPQHPHQRPQIKNRKPVLQTHQAPTSPTCQQLEYLPTDIYQDREAGDPGRVRELCVLWLATYLPMFMLALNEVAVSGDKSVLTESPFPCSANVH